MCVCVSATRLWSSVLVLLYCVLLLGFILIRQHHSWYLLRHRWYSMKQKIYRRYTVYIWQSCCDRIVCLCGKYLSRQKCICFRFILFLLVFSKPLVMLCVFLLLYLKTAHKRSMMHFRNLLIMIQYALVCRYWSITSKENSLSIFLWVYKNLYFQYCPSIEKISTIVISGYPMLFFIPSMLSRLC